jgi:hypothetical protein
VEMESFIVLCREIKLWNVVLTIFARCLFTLLIANISFVCLWATWYTSPTAPSPSFLKNLKFCAPWYDICIWGCANYYVPFSLCDDILMLICYVFLSKFSPAASILLRFERSRWQGAGDISPMLLLTLSSGVDFVII